MTLQERRRDLAKGAARDADFCMCSRPLRGKTGSSRNAERIQHTRTNYTRSEEVGNTHRGRTFWCPKVVDVRVMLVGHHKIS